VWTPLVGLRKQGKGKVQTGVQRHPLCQRDRAAPVHRDGTAPSSVARVSWARRAGRSACRLDCAFCSWHGWGKIKRGKKAEQEEGTQHRRTDLSHDQRGPAEPVVHHLGNQLSQPLLGYACSVCPLGLASRSSALCQEQSLILDRAHSRVPGLRRSRKYHLMFPGETGVSGHAFTHWKCLQLGYSLHPR
jgi:hypothetical protein